MTKSYVKDANGKYRLVENKETSLFEQVPQSEVIRVLKEATELIRSCTIILEQRK